MTTDETKQAHVLLLLGELGGTSESVAASLAERGVTGRPAEPGCCPIAAYLKQSGVDVTYVSSMEIHVGDEKLLVCDEVPGQVAQFIIDFDSFPDGYKELLDPAWRPEVDE